MSILRQCFWELVRSKLGNILVLRSLQSEVDFKGDAKFAQDMKTGAVSDLAKSKSLSEQPAKRVAEKMEIELGDFGGYAIRFEDVTGHKYDRWCPSA
ncbi:hypothetical protein Tco_1522263 [Tanacetum coccineum]